MEAEPGLGLRFHALDPGAACLNRHLGRGLRTWLTTLSSTEGTSTQVEVTFTAALDTDGLLGEADERATAALRAAITSGDRNGVAHLATGEQLPLLLAISDNGPQMRSVIAFYGGFPAAISASVIAARTLMD